MKTEAVIFSKNRTLQLKSLLLSLREFSDLPEEMINIIYVESGGISYEVLKKEFRCRFIKQSAFLGDVKNIVADSKAEYILFMVDDLIFREKFSIEREERILDGDKGLDSFSHRLGKNIQVGRTPSFRRLEDDVIEWETSGGLGKHWNYFWEVSSSTYRKKLVLEYLSKCRPDRESFPNPFEFHYYSCMPSTRASGLIRLINSLRYPFRRKSSRIACYLKSRCFTQGVNLVAAINDKRDEVFDILTLHKKMEEGYIVDYHVLKDAEIKAPNAGPEYFRLVKQSEKGR